MANKSYKAARTLIKNKLCGVLATQSVTMDGYPFGSFVTYCIAPDGGLVLMLSDIAQHTKNIKKNNKVSVTVVDKHNNDDIQNTARATILGTVTQYKDQAEIAKIYTKFFPDAEDYYKAHDFNLYHLQVERIRYIGGFGDINWLNSKPFLANQSFTQDCIESVISHMNNDHQQALNHYTRELRLEEPTKMIYFDHEGMWLQSDRNYYIEFKHDVTDVKALRQVLTDMARQT